MGEMADYYIDRMLHAMPRFGVARRLKTKVKPACKICGATKVHWRLFQGQYRFVPHVCPTTADGFEDVPDA